MKALHMIAFVLLVIGGLNWGLIGLGGFAGSDWNVVHLIFSFSPTVEWIVYILVGLSAVWLAIEHRKSCKMCTASSM